MDRVGFGGQGERPMIDVVDLHKSYRSGDRVVEALRGVRCQVPKGRFAFIVGPSGSGKSTLLYLLGALDRPTSGSIEVDGDNLTTMSEAEQNAYRRDRVGFIFQSFNLISNLTAVENVLIPFLPRGLTPDCGRGPSRSCARWGWATGSTIALTRCREASSSAWRLPGP